MATGAAPRCSRAPGGRWSVAVRHKCTLDNHCARSCKSSIRISGCNGLLWVMNAPKPQARCRHRFGSCEWAGLCTRAELPASSRLGAERREEGDDFTLTRRASAGGRRAASSARRRVLCSGCRVHEPATGAKCSACCVTRLRFRDRWGNSIDLRRFCDVFQV
jgi:hypothetical protein